MEGSRSSRVKGRTASFVVLRIQHFNIKTQTEDRMFKSINFKKKLIMGFSFVSLITLIVGITGFMGAGKLGNTLAEIAGNRTPSIFGLGLMNEGLTGILRCERSLLIDLPGEDAKRLQVRLGESWKTVDRGWKIYEPLSQSKEEEALCKDFVVAWDKWKKEHLQVMTLISEHKLKEAKDLSFGAPAKSFNDAQSLLVKILELNKKYADDELIKGNALIRSIKTICAATTVIAFIIAVGLGVLVARNIMKQLGADPTIVVAITQRVAQGDLTPKIDIDRKNENSLLGAVAIMTKSLKEIVHQTVESSNQVALAADQIATANQSFSQKITEQAASVEETTATMEEMSASIKSTAENSLQASSLAKNTKTLTEGGSTVMQDTIKAMDEINRSSRKIANISNVIEEIAFQTNLLALNAAVEAARAGEHGKGFAVVASEIRSLAGRTTQSAKEITNLIEDSSEKTGRGVMLAQELSKKLEEIGDGIKKVTDLMDEVAAAAQEQSSGINQVNTAMGQVDQATQQNASLVEETSAAAEELAAQAKGLLDIIGFFKADDVGNSGQDKKAGGTVAAAVEPKSSTRQQSATGHSWTPKNKAAALAGGGNGGFSEF